MSEEWTDEEWNELVLLELKHGDKVFEMIKKWYDYLKEDNENDLVLNASPCIARAETQNIIGSPATNDNTALLKYLMASPKRSRHTGW